MHQGEDEYGAGKLLSPVLPPARDGPTDRSADWSRTGCDFSDSSIPGALQCETGACNGGLECDTSSGTGVPPVSLYIRFRINTSGSFAESFLAQSRVQPADQCGQLRVWRTRRPVRPLADLPVPRQMTAAMSMASRSQSLSQAIRTARYPTGTSLSSPEAEVPRTDSVLSTSTGGKPVRSTRYLPVSATEEELGR